MGDFSGHPFRGNQWTDTAGGGVPVGTRVLSRSSAEYPPRNPNGKDTRERFRDAQGNYTPERKAFHDAIVAKFLAETTPVRNPQATLVGGGPAAGKSSIASDNTPENTVKIDVDEVRKELPEYQEQVGKNKEIAAFTHEESSEIAQRITKAAAANHRNLLLDGTGNGTKEKLFDRLAYLRAHDYRISAKYVVIDPDEAVARMRERGKRTGRFVPEDYVRDIHRGIAQVLPAAIKAGGFDDIEVYDNNGASPKLIMIGGRGRGSVILDAGAWEAFLSNGR